MSTISDLLALQDKKFKTHLREARIKYQQSTDKGDAGENAFREFLRNYLPGSYTTGRGEIIDSYGASSNQTDTVVLTDDHPYRGDTGADLYIIEGVAAAAEVKTNLSSQQLDSTLEKAVAFKRLRRSEMATANMPKQTVKKYRQRAPYFLFAYESQLTLETTRKNIFDFQKRLDPGNPNLDAVFVLNRGLLLDMGNGESLSLSTPEGMEPSYGFILRRTRSVLLEMLAWMNVVMVRSIAPQSILQPYLLGNMDRVQTELLGYDGVGLREL